MIWVRKNWGVAATFALIFCVALGGVVDSYRQRQLVKQLQANIVERTEKFEEAMKDGEKMWLSVINPVTKDRDALRKKLSKIEKKTFVKPESVEEEMKRWRNLGYEVEPCK